MAALRGLGVDNVDGRDRRAGSADHGRQRRALRRCDRPGRHRRASRPAAATSRFSSRSASTTGEPSPSSGPMPRGFRLEVEIDFDTSADRPPDAWRSTSTPPAFRRDIARARTFGFMRDVEQALERRALRSAPRSRTRVVIARRPRHQPRRPALRRRVRAPQGARRHRRSGACRRAAPRRATAPIAAATSSTQRC